MDLITEENVLTIRSENNEKEKEFSDSESGSDNEKMQEESSDSEDTREFLDEPGDFKDDENEITDEITPSQIMALGSIFLWLMIMVANILLILHDRGVVFDFAGIFNNKTDL